MGLQVWIPKLEARTDETSKRREEKRREERVNIKGDWRMGGGKRRCSIHTYIAYLA